MKTFFTVTIVSAGIKRVKSYSIKKLSVWVQEESWDNNNVIFYI